MDNLYCGYNDDFSKDNFLITGASGGIGRAVAARLSEAGAKLILMGRDKASLEKTASLLKTSYFIAPFDLTDLEAIPEAFENLLKNTGPLTGLAFSAGLGGRKRLRDITPAYFLDMIKVNCLSFVSIVRYLNKIKKKADLLKIVAISSLAAISHDKYMTAYAASKGALEAAARSMSVELAARNIRINLIRPANVDTPLLDGEGPDFRDNLKESGYQPLGLIEPGEVANLAAFALSPAAAKITGAVFTINAGAPC